MKKLFLTVIFTVATAPALADVSYVTCAVQTTFRKPTAHNTEWVHKENAYTKVFKLDSSAKMVYAFNHRNGLYVPICGEKNSACDVDWKEGTVMIDGTKLPDDPSPHLDFRRSIALTAKQSKVRFVIADFGDNTTGKANMTWTYDGSCKPTAEPAPVRDMGPGPGAARPSENPNYEVPKSPSQAISTEERDRAVESYRGNTMWGYSGGGHWFHMWLFDDAVGFTGDDEDMSSEGKTRQWYIGKDSTGYRMCSRPIPPEGESGCYPFLIKKVGESWIQHDMDGDPEFSLLPGRQ